METKKDVHQEIMDKVYDLWKKHENWSREDLMEHISYKERIALVLGNLNYQVCNGGFAQWKCNGYALDQHRVLMNLEVDSKIYPELTKALELTKEYIKKFGYSNAYERRRCFDEYDEDDEEEEEESSHDLDMAYYELNNVLEEMNSFIQTIED